jgi:hypothetical protein
MSPIRAVCAAAGGWSGADALLWIAPHPDDELMGPGGTLLRAVANGKDITVVFLTDGESILARPPRAELKPRLLPENLAIKPCFSIFRSATPLVTRNTPRSCQSVAGSPRQRCCARLFSTTMTIIRTQTRFSCRWGSGGSQECR